MAQLGNRRRHNPGWPGVALRVSVSPPALYRWMMVRSMAVVLPTRQARVNTFLAAQAEQVSAGGEAHTTTSSEGMGSRRHAAHLRGQFRGGFRGGTAGRRALKQIGAHAPSR